VLRYLSSSTCFLPFIGLVAFGCETPTLGVNPNPRLSMERIPYEGPRATAKSSDGFAVRNSEPVGRSTVVEGTGKFINDKPVKEALEGTSGPDSVSLNLVGVPVVEAAKVVLGDLLHEKYVVDPTVKGEVTIQTSKPISQATAFDLFQAALATNGAAVVASNGTYRIVPLDKAMVGAPITTGSAAGVPFGNTLRVISLKFVAPSEIQRVLEAMGSHGNARADDARQIITLSGSRQEIASMMETISMFDADIMKGMSFAMVPVRSAQPSAIAEELKTVFGSERDAGMSGMIRFLPNNRLRAILVISPNRQYISRAEQWVRKFDAQAEGSEKQFFTYSVQNRRAQDLVGVLQSMFSGETAGTGNRNVAPSFNEATIATQPPIGQPGSNTMFQSLVGAPTANAQPLARPATSGRSNRPTPAVTLGMDEASGEARFKIAADPAKNALLIEATPADYKRILHLIGSLDVIPNQVLIEATIAEVTLNDDLKLGVRWFLQNKRKTEKLTLTDVASGAVGSTFPGFSYALTAANLALTLNTLNKITDINVVSSPSLTVMDNSTATLQIGDQVPITTQSATSVLVGGGIINSVSYRDTGVILSITPRINESGRVLLDIEQEVSTVASTTSSNIDSPTIRQRRIKTSVLVNDSESLALGGMIQESRSLARSQIPIIGDLPLFGNAFKSKENELGKTELLILITPHVIRNFDEAAQVRDEFRRALQLDAASDPRRQRAYRQPIQRTFE
jgi:general secretion pathway protein D